MAQKEFFVLEKGNKGERVPDTVSIFNSKSCVTRVRPGKSTENGQTNDNSDNILTQTLYNAIYDKTEPSLNLPPISTAVTNGTLPSSPVANEIEGSITKVPISDIYTTPDIEILCKEQETILKRMTSEIESWDFPTTSVASVTKWFDDMEKFVDSLPTMNDAGTVVYVVIKDQNGDWVYTGESEYMNVDWNDAVQNAKARFCKVLNDKIEEAINKATSFLDSLTSSSGIIGKFIKLIQSIVNISLSLKSIIKWATMVVEFFKALYELFFGTYQMIMTLLQLIIIRFPQLISKILQKLVEFNCPITKSSSNIKIQSPK